MVMWLQIFPPAITALAGSLNVDTKSVRVPGQPPDWLFPIVWTMLYTLLAYTNLWDEPVYYINLILNAWWPKVYFVDKNKDLSFKIILGLIATGTLLALKRPILWIYVAWLVYAAWLSKP